MTDREHAAEDPMKPAGSNTAQHAAARHAHVNQLPKRDHSVLTLRDARYRSVGSGLVDFFPHTGHKSTSAQDSPPPGAPQSSASLPSPVPHDAYEARKLRSMSLPWGVSTDSG